MSYRPLRAFQRIVTGKGRLDALGAATYALTEGGAVSPSGSSGALGVFYLDPVDFPAGKLRVRAVAATNATAPACTFTAGLYPVTASAGAAANVSATLGAATATAAIATPAATSQATALSSEIAVPAAGYYTLAVVIDTNMAASSAVVFRATLEGR